MTTATLPRKPVKASITRVLKAAGLAKHIDGGMFGVSADGFDQRDTSYPGCVGGSAIVVSWVYSAQHSAKFSRLMGGSEAADKKISEVPGHGERIETAVKALTAAGYSVTVEQGRNGRELWVQDAVTAKHREWLADRRERAAEIAADLLPQGEVFLIRTTEYPTHASGERRLNRADTLTVMTALIQGGFMKMDDQPSLTLVRYLGNGIMSPWHKSVITAV